MQIADDPVDEIVWKIRCLKTAELLELKRRLGNEFGLPPDAGVREPRKPRPSRGGASAPFDEKEDNPHRLGGFRGYMS